MVSCTTRSLTGAEQPEVSRGAPQGSSRPDVEAAGHSDSSQREDPDSAGDTRELLYRSASRIRHEQLHLMLSYVVALVVYMLLHMAFNGLLRLFARRKSPSPPAARMRASSPFIARAVRAITGMVRVASSRLSNAVAWSPSMP